MSQSHTFTTSAGNVIRASVYVPEKPSKPGTILYVHGFKGFKDWGFVPWLGEQFSGAGYHFVAFNFSHNGIGEDLQNFTELEKFEANTFSLELEETQEMIDALLTGSLTGREFPGPLGLLGHSRGGGIALLAAAESPSVRSVCTWSSVSHFDRFDDQALKSWQERGFVEVKNSRTGQIMRLGKGLFQDLKATKKGRLDIRAAVKNLQKPLLILHGTEDESVGAYEAEELNLFGDLNLTRMQLIPGAGHTYQARHPFAGSTPELEQAFGYSLDFFHQTLGS